jgi:hypothetical protein
MIKLDQASLTNALNFVLKWLAVSVVVYFGWNKLAPWIDGLITFI